MAVRFLSLLQLRIGMLKDADPFVLIHETGRLPDTGGKQLLVLQLMPSGATVGIFQRIIPALMNLLKRDAIGIRRGRSTDGPVPGVVMPRDALREVASGARWPLAGLKLRRVWCK